MLDWVLAARTMALTELSSFPRSKLPSRSSICMVKPPALPMPWIGGGGSTRTLPSSMTASFWLRSV